MNDPDPQVALVRLWAQTTADLIDVAQAFWNGLLNLNPVERLTWADACEGSTFVPPQTTALTLSCSDLVDAHGNVMPNADVTVDPNPVPPSTTPTRVSISVTPTGVSGRYTAMLLGPTGAPVSNRFSVYMAGG